MDPSELSGLPKLIWNGLIGELGYADNPTVFAVCAVLCVVVPYLLGSINFAVIFSRRMYADDVRDHGSGNAGSTNMLRTYGVKSALLTFAGDFTKSFVATAMGLLIMPWYTGFAFISGFMCLLGHAFPVFFGFRGGKCVASLAGVVLSHARVRAGGGAFGLCLARFHHRRGPHPRLQQHHAVLVFAAASRVDHLYDSDGGACRVSPSEEYPAPDRGRRV